MNKIYRNTENCNLRALGESRTIEGYAVVFNERSVFLPDWNKGRMVEEVMMPGSITDDLIATSDVVANINHDNARMVARSVNGDGSLSLSVDERGLKFSFEAPQTNDGETVLQGVRRGDFRGCSFAYSCDENEDVRYDKNETDPKALTRYVERVSGLYDVSVVLHPAYPQTNVESRAAVLDDALQRGQIDEFYSENNINSKSEEEEMEENIKNVEEVNGVETRDFDALKNKVDELERNNEALAKRMTVTKTVERKRNFSLTRAIRSIANGNGLDSDSRAVDAEGRKQLRDAGIQAGGQIVIPQSRTAITVTGDSGAHDDTIGIDVYNTIAPIQEGLIAVQAGATLYSGLVNDVRIPVLNKGNVGWNTETGNASDPSFTFSSVNLSPNRLTAQFKVSKQMIAQDNAMIEETLINSLRGAVAEKLNESIFATVAADNAPTGIGVNQTPATCATWATLAAMEASAERSAAGSNFAYIVSPESAAVIRSMTYGTQGKTTRNVYEGGNVDGTNCIKSVGCAANFGYYGDWSNLIIGNWGGGAYEITVDPYTAAATGELVITVNSYWDFAVARVTSTTVGSGDEAVTTYNYPIKLFTTVASEEESAGEGGA